MLTPIRGPSRHGIDALLDALTPPSFAGQTAQLLPTKLNQIQPAGILREEQRGYFGPGDQGSLRLPPGRRAQIKRRSTPTRHPVDPDEFRDYNL